MSKGLFLLCFFIFFPLRLFAESIPEFDEKSKAQLDIKPTDVVHWRSSEATISSSNIVSVGLQLSTEGGFSIYASKLKFEGPIGFSIIETKVPSSQMIVDPISGKEVSVYTGGDFQLTFEGIDFPKDRTFNLAITYLGCSVRLCLFPYTERLVVKLYPLTAGQRDGGVTKPFTTSSQKEKRSPSKESGVAAAASREIATEGAHPRKENSFSAGDVAATGAEKQHLLARKVEKGELSGVLLLVVLFLGGLATNMTPCVFPMIPITLRILGGRRDSTFIPALLYSLGIVVTYSLLGIVVSFTGGVFGALLASHWVNITFALLFSLLAFSMLGYGNFSWMQNLGQKIGTSRFSYVRYFAMGAGAGLVGAPCTGPILGALMTFAANRPDESILLFFTYSCGFALPYLILGVVAKKVTHVRAPGWVQSATKLFFAAAMFGLAFYFMRIPLSDPLKLLRDQWGLIALSTAVIYGVAITGVLVGVRFLRDQRGFYVLTSLLLGLFFFAGWQWYTVATEVSSTHTGKEEIQLHWFSTVEEARSLALQEKKPMLVDFWAEWCEACKKMDVTTFSDPKVREILARHWVLVRYDLTKGDDADSSLSERFSIYGLPVIGMIPVGGDVSQIIKLNGYVEASLLIEKLKEVSPPQ